MLMCREHEAAAFAWSVLERRAVGRIDAIDPTWLPWGARDHRGRTNRHLLTRWMRERAIPSSRPGALRRLRAIGADDALTLVSLGSGASLSDQYWFREQGSDACWKQVSFFSNDYDQRLGEYRSARRFERCGELAAELAHDLAVAANTPDAALGVKPAQALGDTR